MLTATAMARDPMHERIYERLRAALMYGELEAGRSLAVPEIAALFSVSVTPARDALKRLVWEEAIVQLRTGKFQVPVPSLAEIEELREQSKLFEGLLVRKAVPKVTDALIAELEADWRRSIALARDGAGLEARKLHREMRHRLFAVAGSAWLLKALERVWLRRGPCGIEVYEAFSRRVSASGPRQRQPLMAAIRARDAEAAEAEILLGTDLFFDVWAETVASKAGQGRGAGADQGPSASSAAGPRPAKMG